MSHLAVLLWPNARLPRGYDAIRIHCVLDNLVELQQGAIVPIVCAHNLIHNGQMGSIFSPPVGCTVIDERLDKPVGFLLLLGILLVEYNTHNVICARIQCQPSSKRRKGWNNLRNSRMPTVNVPRKSKPTSWHLLLVTAYCAMASSPETFAIGEKKR